METWQGQGAYGAVYRAVNVDQEHQGPVALKCSLLPWDARLAREGQLLSLLCHPSIPRLLDRGVLRLPSGVEHPFFIMEWVEGTSLYAWAQQHAPTHRQLCLVLAQLARALEAIHGAGAVHRDIKGDNVLVRHSDGRAVLIDFGSGHFQGAARLTWQSLAPGTPGYLSAQACLFDIRLVRARDSYYAPTPADDLFALGVTAYRLVMGEYPPAMDAREDERGDWHVFSPDARPLLEGNARVQPLLREWILRLLSDTPQERGTAGQLAQALEAAAQEQVEVLQPAATPAAEEVPPEVSTPAGASVRLERPKSKARVRAWKPWLALAFAGVCAVLLWSVQPLHVRSEEVPDGCACALGDTSPTMPGASSQPATEQPTLAQELPPEPRPGQIQPNAKGQCPGRVEVAFNGGCWVEIPLIATEACVESGYVLLKSKCFSPALKSPQKPVPTSGTAKPR